MLKILLNGKAVEILEDCTLADALIDWGYQNGIYAVALNQTFVPRDLHRQTILQNGDAVEVVAPMQGG